MKLIFVIFAILALVCADKYSWKGVDGELKPTNIQIHADHGADVWKADQTTHVTITGTMSESHPILAGTVKYKLYEDYVQYFVDQGNMNYFHCTNKGCDPSQPLSMEMNVPAKTFKITFPFKMVKAQKTGQFRMEIWGQDQTHYPYDFSAQLRFNYTAFPRMEEEQQVMPTVNLELEEAAAMNTKFSVKHVDNAMKIKTFDFQAPALSQGQKGRVTFTGDVQKRILAGIFKWKIYEDYVQYFVDQGNVQFFHCDNKGCYCNKPISLQLGDCEGYPTTFKAGFDFTLPKAQKTGQFRVVLWGQDQDHYPYLTNVQLRFNYTNFE